MTVFTWAVLAPPLTGVVLTPWSLLTATAGLIAFHIGLYTLVGRERKSPYAINAVFPIFFLCLLIAAIALLSALIPADWAIHTLWVSGALLVLAFLWSALNVYHVAVRFMFFVDRVRWGDIPFVRARRLRRILHDPAPTYTHSSVPVPEDLKNQILEILGQFPDSAWDDREALDPKSLAVAVQHQGQGNRLLAELAEAFLKKNFTVQYLTASRHPIEFVDFLQIFLKKRGLDLKSYRNNIVVIDAYSPHFAFLDSVYPRKDRELRSLGITRIASTMTYAGMHSASSRAFKTIQKQIAGTDRSPTLVIYEDSYALSDLESAEQYRIFVRHVMPSERMWDGMFTVFLESAQADADWKMLQAYASMRLDLRSAPAIVDRKSADPSPKAK
ncbi:MAG TPA: hypothetical protein VGO06_00870 [Bosea sp. (in: a-proteobacteria)]|jgi:hypothetical protein|uniref:hypothetical protein n=1 Tax=Bosea sp. (in: a-proteobacteria) TaxID=1871050 RepID=UPI002E119994|nr:hypothetical protein [Bosea sp. (in: a-proteobacteria)]